MVRTFTTILKTPHAKCLFGATGTIQTAYLQNLLNKLTLLTDQNWPIMTNLHYLSLRASNMTAKLTN